MTTFEFSEHTVTADRDNTGEGDERIVSAVTDGDGTIIWSAELELEVGETQAIGPGQEDYDERPASNPLTFRIVSPAGNGQAAQLVFEAEGIVPPEAAPGPPEIIEVVEGSGSLSVDFRANQDDDACNDAVAYTLTCLDGDDAVVGEESGEVTPITISGLTPGEEHECTVTAQNRVGEDSDPSEVETGTPGGVDVPGQPQNLEVLTEGDGAVQLGFDGPVEDGGSPILGYRATCLPPGDTALPKEPVEAVEAVSPITVGGLVNDVTYECSVQAVNEVDLGPPSDPVDATPVPAPNPFADVPAGAFFEHPVAWLSSAGITTGVGGGDTFAPFEGTTRGEVAAFLYRLAGSPPVSGDHGFVDVPEGAFFETPVTWLAQQDITTGVGGGDTFAPFEGTTRGEVAAFLYRVSIR